jgi:hypothetical protein
MSKLQELCAKYEADMKSKMGYSSVDSAALEGVAKACGPSIYNNDASTVSSSDQAELDRVKNNFLKKKLGLSDSDGLDAAIDYAVDKIGKSNRNKYRAVFYYILAEKYGKLSQFK